MSSQLDVSGSPVPTRFPEVDEAAQKLVNHLFERYAARVQATDELVVNIPEDPVALGLSNFNILISKNRINSNTCSQLLSELTRERAACRDRLNSARAAFDEKLNHMLSSDEEVKEVKGQQAKKALATEKLAKQKVLVDWCERILAMVQSYFDATKLAHDRCKDIKRDLMTQLDIVRAQISMGEVDGSKFPVGAAQGRPQNGVEAAERALAEEFGGELPSGSMTI